MNVEAQDTDVDIVDIDSDTKTNGDEVYEYYYVYYDEDGNIVSKNQTPAALPVIKDKVQEIPLSPVKLDTKNNIPSSNDEKPGDTPTIYAQIQDLDEHEDTKKGGEDSEKEEEGLSIFGIPIPKIPLPILSFGLMPAMSHGLLPIGRKGDPSSTEEDVIRTRKRPVNTRYKQKDPSVAQQLIPDLTRGPDSILDPIWVEGIENAASVVDPTQTYLNKDDGNTYLSQDEVNAYLAQDDAKNNIEHRLTQNGKDKLAIYHTSHQQRPFGRPHVKKGHTKAYGYLRPQNPIIPLTNTDDENMHYTIPKHRIRNGNLPALKFDHPVPSIQSVSSQTQSGNVPISLSPSLKRQQVFPPSHSVPGNGHKYVYAPEGNQMFKNGGIKITDRWQTEAGFVPIFNPDLGDPIYMQDAQKQDDKIPSAFPGIDATLRNKPPVRQPNFNDDKNQVKPILSNIDKAQASADQGMKSTLQAHTDFETAHGIHLNVPYSSNGKYSSQEPFLRQQYYNKDHQATPIPLVLRPTKIPPRLNTPPPVVWGQSSFNLDSIKEDLLNKEYSYNEYPDGEVYTDDGIDYENYSNSATARENSRSTTIKQVGEEVRVQSSTTERYIPTLSVEEVLPTEDLSKISLDFDSRTTEMVDNNLEDTSTEREHRTGAAMLPNEEVAENNVGKDGEKEPEYEYEYYYEYYEDDNQTKSDYENKETEEISQDQIAENSEISEQVSNEDVVSLQNILNLIDGKTKTTHQIASTVHSLMVEDVEEREMALLKGKIKGEHQIKKPPFVSSSMNKVPPKFRATLPPPIRTSTFVPYDNNYLDNQRSTVTVDYNLQKGSSKDGNYNIRAERDGQSEITLSEGEHQMVRSKGNSGISSKDVYLNLQPKGRSSNDQVRLQTPDASGASPFHPDQMDPVSAVENRNDKNNEVKWYYSNYNSENIDPYISPSRANRAAGSTISSISHPYFKHFSLFTVLTLVNFLFLKVRN